MTLSTKIYVQGRLDPKVLFQVCNRLIGAPTGFRFTDKESVGRKDGRWIIGNEPGQGLPAWLMVHYRPDGPLWPEGEPHDKEWCEPECDGAYHDPPCYALVDFDTAYGYRDELGGCGDLHARLVESLGRLLDEGSVPWSWRNEFTGEVHRGYDGLDELGTGGREAADWFENVVRPAIESGGLLGKSR